MVGKLPAQVTIVTRLTDGVDLIHLFATRAAELGDKLRISRDAIKSQGIRGSYRVGDKIGPWPIFFHWR
jgi:hypothetical protein